MSRTSGPRSPSAQSGSQTARRVASDNRAPATVAPHGDVDVNQKRIVKVKISAVHKMPPSVLIINVLIYP